MKQYKYKPNKIKACNLAQWEDFLTEEMLEHEYINLYLNTADKTDYLILEDGKLYTMSKENFEEKFVLIREYNELPF